MKATDSRKKITIEINGEKIRASKGFFLDYSRLMYEAEDRARKEGFNHYADSLKETAFKIYDELNNSGYFDDIRRER